MVMSMEKTIPYACNCGGKLRRGFCSVEFFGIDFGERECEVCTSCGGEFLDDKTLEEIEQKVKEKKLFGLEKQITVAKSGNSLVFRIPPEIAKSSKIFHKSMTGGRMDGKFLGLKENRPEPEGRESHQSLTGGGRFSF